jgi:hypothetical protein
MSPKSEAGDRIMDTTGKSLADHWRWAAGKGLMNSNTANGWTAACRKVLGTEKDWETADISKMNVDETIRRFENLEKKNFTPRSLNTYGVRFRQAHASYLSYLKDPGGWKPDVNERASRPERNGSNSKKKMDTVTVPIMQTEGTEKGQAADYPFPLRQGFTARLILPRDLKAAEVKRLSAFMTTLTVDFEEAAIEPR